MVLITCVLATIFHKHLLLQNKLAWNCYWQGQRVNECTPVFYNIKHISAKNIHPLRIFNPEKYSSQKTFTPKNIHPWKYWPLKNILCCCLWLCHHKITANIIFLYLEPPAFEKYSIHWVLEALFICLCRCRCRCRCLCRSRCRCHCCCHCCFCCCWWCCRWFLFLNSEKWFFVLRDISPRC